MKPFACRMCQERGQTWEGDAPKCAFDQSGRFKSDNWNCATMNALRNIASGTPDNVFWTEDTHLAVIPFRDDCKFLVICWYKSRGRTGTARIVDSDGNAADVHVSDAEAILLERKP